MPHSVSPEDTSTPNGMLAEAEPDNEDTQASEDTLAADTNTADSQMSNAADQDMTMVDVGIEGEDIPQIKTEIKTEVKLEDLFADIKSDDEFSSSNGPNVKLSSSPEAPSSPV